DVEQAGSGIEAQAQDAGEFGPDDDDIADLDRLFEALNAAEQGVTGTPSDAVESPEGLTADADEAFAAEPAPAPSDDWLARFRESEPAEVLQPALGASETPPAEADVLPWDLLAEEASDADRAEAPPAYAREADAPPPEAGIQEEMG